MSICSEMDARYFGERKANIITESTHTILHGWDSVSWQKKVRQLVLISLFSFPLPDA